MCAVCPKDPQNAVRRLGFLNPPRTGSRPPPKRFLVFSWQRPSIVHDPKKTRRDRNLRANIGSKIGSLFHTSILTVSSPPANFPKFIYIYMSPFQPPFRRPLDSPKTSSPQHGSAAQRTAEDEFERSGGLAEVVWDGLRSSTGRNSVQMKYDQV